MNYTMLMRGDRLPMVGVLQLLLTRTDIPVSVDGIFGEQTYQAVKRFQRERSMQTDGIVGKDTWARITAQTDLPIVDAIDIYDPTFDQQDATFIKKAGGDPIVIGGACNGVEQMVSLITRSNSGVFLLRFHGHGAPGVAGVSDGHEDGSEERSDISSDIEILNIVAQLKPIFGPYGSVEFIQCQTGRGAKGRRLLSEMANRLQVPVTAAVNDQPFGEIWSFRLSGPTVTQCPGGQSLSQWCKSRPPFPGMSVM